MIVTITLIYFCLIMNFSINKIHNFFNIQSDQFDPFELNNNSTDFVIFRSGFTGAIDYADAAADVSRISGDLKKGQCWELIDYINYEERTPDADWDWPSFFKQYSKVENHEKTGSINIDDDGSGGSVITFIVQTPARLTAEQAREALLRTFEKICFCF